MTLTSTPEVIPGTHIGRVDRGTPGALAGEGVLCAGRAGTLVVQHQVRRVLGCLYHSI